MASFIRFRLLSPFWMIRKGAKVPNMPEDLNIALQEIPKGIVMQKSFFSNESAFTVEKLTFWQGVLAVIIAGGATYFTLKNQDDSHEQHIERFSYFTSHMHDQNLFE